jgi:cytochrome P450
LRVSTGGSTGRIRIGSNFVPRERSSSISMSGSVPARIVPPERALPPLRLLRTVVDNPIKAWPRAIYRERIVRSRVLGRDTVYVMAPDLIRQMLADETDDFEKGEIARRGLGPVLGDAILTADGSRWRWQRHAGPVERVRGSVADARPR